MGKTSILIVISLPIFVVQALPENGKLLTPEEGCGKSKKTTPKIVGGINAEPDEFPWIAILGFDYGSHRELRCGGSLITSSHVMTAAHCEEDALSFVRLGEYDLSTSLDGPAQDVGLVKIDKHEEYNNVTHVNDIAILTLERNVLFSDHIRPICLPMDEPILSRSFVDYNPFLAGWGSLSEGGSPAKILQQVQVRVRPDSDCEELFLIYSKKNAQLCAGGRVGEDSCQGDSGGPMMLPLHVNGSFSFYQIGIISYGMGCGQKNIPAVYTNVQHYIGWIQSKVNNSRSLVRNSGGFLGELLSNIL